MSTVFSYSPHRGYWTQCCSMPQARARHAAVSVGGSSIYVFGGLTVSHQSDDNSELTPVDHHHHPQQSQPQPQLGTQRTNNSASSLWQTPGPDAHHTVEGVVPRLSIVNTIIRYDVLLDTWTTVGRTNEPRLESRIVIIDDYRSPSAEMDCFCDPEAHECSNMGDTSGGLIALYLIRLFPPYPLLCTDSTRIFRMSIRFGHWKPLTLMGLEFIPCPLEEVLGVLYVLQFPRH